MSEAKLTPKRRSRGVTLLGASAVLMLLIGGSFAVGQAVADQAGPTAASSSQSDQLGRTAGYGSMMGSLQADRDDLSWMRDHMDDVAWRRHHTARWQWMEAHPGMWTWMRRNWDDVPWVGQGRSSRERHPATSNGNVDPRDPGWCW